MAQFLSLFKLKYIQNIVSLRWSRVFESHGIAAFTDDLYAINDVNEFSISFKYVYRIGFELKIKRLDTHATKVFMVMLSASVD